MKVVYKNEVIFKLIYFVLISLTGVFISIYSSDGTVTVISILVPIIYIPLAFRKEIRRLRIVKRQFPSELREIIGEYSKFYNFLDDNGKQKFEKDVNIFLNEHSIRGIRGEETDLRTKVLVAAGVATILHGRQEWEPPFTDGVVVYPGETFDPEYNLHKGQIAGMAGERRPLLVTKEILEQSFRDPGDGYNSLIHEIAHYFDFENPLLSGVPAIGANRERTEEWINIMEEERTKVNNGKSFLRPYAGSNEAEFFAVATESFFERPDVMVKNNPELYELLKGFYNIDTQKILKR
ncbi:MAG: zinc-dependent peptidase [Candidatus Aminicenantes bacterium]|nr:zinc-dependent peptidase [Candidatus Aminicenantes bacterium]